MTFHFYNICNNEMHVYDVHLAHLCMHEHQYTVTSHDQCIVKSNYMSLHIHNGTKEIFAGLCFICKIEKELYTSINILITCDLSIQIFVYC